jgi:hypothetical protein
MPNPREQTIHSAENLDFGICEVELDYVSLGATKGNVTVTITPEIARGTIDKYGSAPLKAWDNGTQITARVPLAESERMEALIAAFPTGTRAGRTVTFGRTAGANELTGKRLRIKPVSGGRIITIYNAVSLGEPIALEYSNEDFRVLEVTFEGMLDTSRPENDQLFSIGGPFS